MSLSRAFRRVCTHYMYRGLFDGKNNANNGKIKIGSQYFNISDQLSFEDEIKLNKKRNNFNHSTKMFGGGMVKRGGGLRGGAAGRKRY